MKEVTKEEYYNFICPKNVAISLIGNFPYTVIWKDRRHNIVAKEIPFGKQLGISTDKSKYYIAV